ncbi:hypothetical protein BH10ACI3_BH10ACI3_26110 [soil metagenome]
MTIRTVTLSTGDVPFKYEIIDLIFAYGSSNETIFQGASPVQAYEKVSSLLERRAAEIGADAVVWVRYEYRVAQSRDFFVPNQVFEVFAYGTAVRLSF